MLRRTSESDIKNGTDFLGGSCWKTTLWKTEKEMDDNIKIGLTEVGCSCGSDFVKRRLWYWWLHPFVM